MKSCSYKIAADGQFHTTVAGSTCFYRVLPIKNIEAPIPVADLRLVRDVLRKVFRNMSNLFDMTASSGCSRKAGESSSDWKRTVTSALPFTTSMMVLAISEACRSPAMVEPFSEEYNTHAAFKKIPLDALKRLPSPMNLICVTPTRIDALFSDFKKDGYSVRQVLHQLA